MCSSLSIRYSLLLIAALLLSGCGDPKQVTYVDPNGNDPMVQGGEGSQPFDRWGAATAERGKAVVRIRGALVTARTLAADDADAAREALDRTLTDDLPLMEARTASVNASASAELRAALERLRDAPPAAGPPYNRAVRRIADTLLTQVADLAVNAEARQDIGFRAAILYETILHAATSYESAFDGDEIETIDEYRVAYGLLVDVTTRQLEALPESSRGQVRAKLDRISRRSLPGPTPPDNPRNPDAVVGELAAVADDVIAAARIDPTYPEPNPATADQLRSLKRAVAAAVEAWERGSGDEAIEQLATADRAHLVPASGGVATVAPELLADLEHGLIIGLPEAMRSRSDVATAAVDLDTLLDESIMLVEEELELMRDVA